MKPFFLALAILALALPTRLTADATGTGFFISSDGYLVTNFHVIEGGIEFTVRHGEKLAPARIIRTDPANDLAILKVEAAALPHLPVIFKPDVRPGDPAFTVGFPDPGVLGLAAKTTREKISALSGIKDDARFYQTTVEIQPGNSGGPLCDEEGNVIGITTQTIDAVKRLEAAGYLPQNINYGLKTAYVRPLIETVPKLDEKLAAPFEGGKFRDAQARVQNSVVLVVARHPEVAATTPRPPAGKDSPAPPPEEPSAKTASPNLLYSGNVGRLKATYMLRWAKDGSVSGSYFYPSRGQEKTYNLRGNNYEQGKLYLEEFTGGALSAKALLTKELTDGEIVWRGAMQNTDGRSFPMTIRRRR